MTSHFCFCHPRWKCVLVSERSLCLKQLLSLNLGLCALRWPPHCSLLHTEHAQRQEFSCLLGPFYVKLTVAPLCSTALTVSIVTSCGSAEQLHRHFKNHPPPLKTRSAVESQGRICRLSLCFSIWENVCLISTDIHHFFRELFAISGNQNHQNTILSCWVRREVR